MIDVKIWCSATMTLDKIHLKNFTLSIITKLHYMCNLDIHEQDIYSMEATDWSQTGNGNLSNINIKDKFQYN
jgi:hypothetical protein